MIAELAVATNQLPDAWARQDPEAILTALEILQDRKSGTGASIGGDEGG